jgi:hypothetical protein
MAINIFSRPGPRIAMMVSTRTMNGNAKTTSTRRMMMLSFCHRKARDQADKAAGNKVTLVAPNAMKINSSRVE